MAGSAWACRYSPALEEVAQGDLRQVSHSCARRLARASSLPSLRNAHRNVGVPRDFRHIDPAQSLVLHFEVGPAGTDAGESKVRLQSGEPRAEAAVHAIAESKRGATAPLDVEGVRFLIDTRGPRRCARQEDHRRIGGYHSPVELHRDRCEPTLVLRRWVHTK